MLRQQSPSACTRTRGNTWMYKWGHRWGHNRGLTSGHSRGLPSWHSRGLTSGLSCRHKQHTDTHTLYYRTVECVVGCCARGGSIPLRTSDPLAHTNTSTFTNTPTNTGHSSEPAHFVAHAHLSNASSFAAHHSLARAILLHTLGASSFFSFLHLPFCSKLGTPVCEKLMENIGLARALLFYASLLCWKQLTNQLDICRFFSFIMPLFIPLVEVNYFLMKNLLGANL